MLAAACGLEAPTKVQSSAWALAMREENKDKGNNRNLLIVAPPGAGKTLAYLLPAAAKVVVEGEEEEEEEEEGSDDDDQNRRKRAKKASSSSSTPSSIPSPRVLILVPTRELARQVAAAARPLAQGGFRPPRIRALNPIGSGDAVTAGIAYGILKGKDIAEGMRLGLACGAANALTLTRVTLIFRRSGN